MVEFLSTTFQYQYSSSVAWKNAVSSSLINAQRMRKKLSKISLSRVECSEIEKLFSINLEIMRLSCGLCFVVSYLSEKFFPINFSFLEDLLFLFTWRELNWRLYQIKAVSPMLLELIQWKREGKGKESDDKFVSF